jgi:hypothetical protein
MGDSLQVRKYSSGIVNPQIRPSEPANYMKGETIPVER